MSTAPFTLLSAAQYYSLLLPLITTAKKRIVIHAMVVAWTPGMDQLLPALRQALQRGVQVDIVGDRYTRIHLPVWGNFEHKYRGVGSWRHTDCINHELAAAGARVAYVGTLRPTNPFAGRCHSKITIVDDTVFSFGGVNFGDQDLRGDAPSLDYMLMSTGRQLADYMHSLVQRIARKPFASLANRQHALGAETTILFDGGKPKKSIIYTTACCLAAKAEEIYYVSQYPPSGQLGYLVSQKQGRCYFNRPGTGDFPLNVPFWLDKLRYHQANYYDRSSYLHAKFMLTIEPDGTRHLLSGSNNFSWSGVRFGTKEVALHSTNEQTWQLLYNFLEDTIA